MADPAAPVAVFRVAGEVSTNLLGRVLGLIGQTGLTPLAVAMCRVGDEILVQLVQDDLAPERAQILVEKLRAVVAVRSAELTFRPSAKDRHD